MEWYARMEQEILLSICIPTYNHPEELRRLLEGLSRQATDEVEIVIGDDGKFEVTAKLLKEFSFPHLVHFKNPDGPGFDKNLLAVTARARGRYAWWFGDDDEFKPGALAHVLGALRRDPRISFVYVNPEVSGAGGGGYPFRDDRYFKDGNEVLRELANLLCFMSSIILSKAALADAERGAIERFTGSGFINLFLVMHALSGKGKFFYVGEPLVVNHPTVGKKSYDGFQVFAVNFRSIALYFKGRFEWKSLKKMLAKNFAHAWRGEIVDWIREGVTRKGKLRTMIKLYWNFPEVLLAVPAFLIPRPLGALIYRLRQRMGVHF
jgi:glycosyltransferase involved in cell wall biosynthesis